MKLLMILKTIGGKLEMSMGKLININITIYHHFTKNYCLKCFSALSATFLVIMLKKKNFLVFKNMSKLTQ